MELMKLTKSERETLKAVYRLTKGDEPAHTGPDDGDPHFSRFARSRTT